MALFCLGVIYGAPADIATMKPMADLLQGTGMFWFAFGAGFGQLHMAARSVLLGRHVRVGLEDNLYQRKDVPTRNQELVGEATRIVNLVGQKSCRRRKRATFSSYLLSDGLSRINLAGAGGLMTAHHCQQRTPWALGHVYLNYAAANPLEYRLMFTTS